MLQWKKLRRRPTNSTSRAPRCCHPHREVVSAPAPRLNSRRPSPTGSSIRLPTPGTRPLFDSDLKLHIGRTLDKESFRCPVSSLARSSSRSRPGPGSQRRAWTSTSGHRTSSPHQTGTNPSFSPSGPPPLRLHACPLRSAASSCQFADPSLPWQPLGRCDRPPPSPRPPPPHPPTSRDRDETQGNGAVAASV